MPISTFAKNAEELELWTKLDKKSYGIPYIRPKQRKQPKTKERQMKSEGMNMEALAELVGQLDGPSLRKFVEEYEVDLDPIILPDYNRLIKRAKTDGGLYFGLLTLLLMGNYTAAREVMSKADNKKMDQVDLDLQFLLTNVTSLREESEMDQSHLAEYDRLYELVVPYVLEYDLHAGYFRRNTKNLKDEWNELETVNDRVDSYEDMYQALWLLMKFRIYIISVMPKVEIS